MKKLALILSIAAASAYIALGFVLSHRAAAKERCGEVFVHVDRNDTLDFVSSAFIASELKRLDIHPEGRMLAAVNTSAIERRFNHMDYVEQAQCYRVGNNGLMVEINPIKPVMRVFDRTGSYYINREGKRVAANAKFHIDLPVVSGNFTKRFPPQRLCPMVDYIDHDPFLRDLVTCIEVRDTNNIFIIPSIAGHVVNMGTADGFQSKFAKLMRMYREVLPLKGWDAYDTISVKWDYQIVATKRSGKSRLNVADYDPEAEEAAPDIATVASSNENIRQNNNKNQ